VVERDPVERGREEEEAEAREERGVRREKRAWAWAAHRT
jgi:hypothetical protein